MPIRFQCLNSACNKLITVKDEHAGKTGKCPACQSSVTVPFASEPAPKSIDPAPNQASPATPAPVARAAPKPPVADDEPDDGAASCVDRSQWFVRAKQGWLVGTHAAEVYDSTKSTEIRAYVWDGRPNLFGLFPLAVPLLPPRRRFVVRDGEPRGPVVLSLAEKPPLTDYLPVGPARATRWEVRDDRDQLVGSILVKPSTVSLIKLAKGQLFQDEHFWLDAKGGKVGAVAIERSGLGMPGALIVQDDDGNQYASFGTAHGERFHDEVKQARGDMREAAEQKGGIKVKWGGSVLPKQETIYEGVIGSVNPERAGDEYSRMMTFGMTVLMQLIGVNKFTGAVTK